MLAAAGAGATVLASLLVAKRTARRHRGGSTSSTDRHQLTEEKNEDLEKMSGDMVAYSSQLIAAWRATEKVYGESALFDDFLAPVLAGPFALKRVEQKSSNNARFSIRTKFFDDWILEATKRDGIGQVVLPAAGMDSRAFRLAFDSDLHLYEIDQAVVMKEKEALLQSVDSKLEPICNRHVVAADLAATDWTHRLMAAGFQKHETSAWVIEGLLYYLTEDEVRSLFKAIRSVITEDSLLLASIITKRRIWGEGEEHKDPTNRLQSKFKWFCENPESFFSSLGFCVYDSVALGSERANFGRWQADFSSNTLYVSLKPIYIVHD
eukprot:Plantae.Rhodophyta-Purpureofilum_apyrenoidigerum.ctg14158.p1 GENE.Plantae.Rhodophyta-Purpureofilum_apyrenoidigerum.ctg14158~~Plantae.Rhodophyta-Purpureofilum_apyrenoidigerum.ctg14158.p1  ORF type:complete len:322 (-),score=46.59 Plantae.Rhodophyta-Purpureofilum_apyrenoidigerum.ctg14158:118-1083(-)